MAVLDEDLGTDLSLAASDGGATFKLSLRSHPDRRGVGYGGILSFPTAEPAREPGDWPSLYERERSRAEEERARADAAEARLEAVRESELSLRCEAGQWKGWFKACRRRLSEAVEETKEARRAARDVPSLQAEVARLETLLSEAGIASALDTAEALRKENARLRKALAASKAREGTAGPQPAQTRTRRTAVERSPEQKETIRSLRTELHRLGREVVRRDKEIARLNARLDREKERTESIRETAKSLSRENLSLYREVRIRGDAEARARSLSGEVYRLRFALEVSEAGKDKLKARLAKLRAVGATLSKLPSDEAAHLRTVLRRSRRQKTTIDRLRKDNARLRKAVKGSRRRIETLEAQLDKLRATGTVLSKKLYGRKSEQQDKPRSERKRGQQRGAPGHGRTQRPGLEERPEEHNPPPAACVCARCGQPYAPNGAEESTLVEIEVKAHRRTISRPRLRRTCECASSPMEVTAPPVPRLFASTLYGISFWTRFLFEHCACLRPVHRVAAWFSGHGLPVSPGTLANSLKRFVPLFEAILAHQNKATLRHADETSWRVQELRGEDRSSRAWLWTSVSSDAVCFRIDPSRSAEAAQKLFAGALLYTVIVCDRYSAYKRLASLLGGLVILAFCWSHVRRDFIECAAGQVKLTAWCRRWVERIAAIYRLNEARLEHYDPALKRRRSTRRRPRWRKHSVSCSRTPGRNWPPCRTRPARARRCARCSTTARG